MYIIENNTAGDMGRVCGRPALAISSPYFIHRSSAAAFLPGRGPRPRLHISVGPPALLPSLKHSCLAGGAASPRPRRRVNSLQIFHTLATELFELAQACPLYVVRQDSYITKSRNQSISLINISTSIGNLPSYPKVVASVSRRKNGPKNGNPGSDREAHCWSWSSKSESSSRPCFG